MDVGARVLVAYLGYWVTSVAGSARRATVACAWDSSADPGAAEAVVRLLEPRGAGRVTVVFLAPGPGDLPERAASRLDVHMVAGSAASHLGPVLTAAQAAGAPVLAYFGGDGDLPARTVAVGRPAELLALTTPGTHARHAETLHAAGFTLMSMVELVGGELLVFGTSSLRSLEAFKNSLWQLDPAVGLRDPHDAHGHFVDLSEPVDVAPLRATILAYLASGPSPVTEIRRFALTGTIYRDADTTEALTGLIDDGAVTRAPQMGRLAGDVIIDLAG